jgi:hypothetical protein
MDMKRRPVFDCPVNATLHVIGGRERLCEWGETYEAQSATH